MNTKSGHTDHNHPLHNSIHTFLVAVFLELGLLEVGVALHLVHGRHNLGRLEKVLCLGDGEV